jgi:UDP-sugar transporter A1/2/3
VDLVCCIVTKRVRLTWYSLITLALQNAFLTIIMHYSRIKASPNQTYSAASAVLLNELLKGSISFVIALNRIDPELLTSAQPHVYTEKDMSSVSRSPPNTRNQVALFHPTRIRVLLRQVISPDCYKLSIPAILYVIQNNLQYVAASNLDVATFQVTYQMKILTTAFFSVLLLRKRLSRGKWASLCMLAVGVGIVQLQSTAAPSRIIPSAGPGVKISHNKAALRSEIPESEDMSEIIESIVSTDRVMHPFRGFVAVALACLTSGLAGVYFEFILKGSSGSAPPPDLWVRNTQLSLFSLVPAIIPILVAPSGAEGVGWLGRVLASFSNFNGWAIGTVLTQTLGGLITAVVIRYSDNIM